MGCGSGCGTGFGVGLGSGFGGSTGSGAGVGFSFTVGTGSGTGAVSAAKAGSAPPTQQSVAANNPAHPLRSSALIVLRFPIGKSSLNCRYYFPDSLVHIH
ncbi:hypothetical protein CJ240_06525 [Varibaculum cambriense]|uniref:Uncharacterized protein n=1 Tax=Varibaculum cambriense TaxID=184870 RepID=A0ABX4UTJ6_9ACTO|nr:hypothetical protein CJ240_06525 [Varibaculum cambriense]